MFNSSGIKLISTSVWDRNQGGNKITDSAIISENVYSIVLPAAKKSSPWYNKYTYLGLNHQQQLLQCLQYIKKSLNSALQILQAHIYTWFTRVGSVHVFHGSRLEREENKASCGSRLWREDKKAISTHQGRGGIGFVTLWVLFVYNAIDFVLARLLHVILPCQQWSIRIVLI